MSTLAVVGAQWGDEGKGKVVDVLAAEADLVARYAGGNNAGHTLVVDGKKIVTHLVPSGCTYPGTRCLLGAGMVIDPEVFADEIAQIQAHGLLQGDELRVSLDAHVIFRSTASSTVCARTPRDRKASAPRGAASGRRTRPRSGAEAFAFAICFAPIGSAIGSSTTSRCLSPSSRGSVASR